MGGYRVRFSFCGDDIIGGIINNNFMNIFEQQEEIMKMVKSSFATKEANEEAEIDEGGEELEDEEKINDAIDTTDLGAKADMEWSKEKDEKAINN